jgi:hypothetical protein
VGGKTGKPTEFGKLLKLQEAENQIIVEYEIFARRPSDIDLLIPAIDVHQAKLGRTRAWSLLMPASTQPGTKLQQKPRMSNLSAFPIALPRASLASASRRSDGSVTVRDGAPAARAASASASAVKISTVAAIEVMMGCSAGLVSA